MRVNNVKHITIAQPESEKSYYYKKGRLTGFFSELNTCDSIEESLKSFDKLEARNAKRRVKRSFEYKRYGL